MNALFELLGDVIEQDAYDELVKTGSISNYEVEDNTNQCSLGKYKITPHYDAPCCIEWVKTIKFAKVKKDNDWGEEYIIRAILRSDRTEEDELKFLRTLSEINYDDGYGGQELFGIIVFKDNTWLERDEYDGSEWWTRRKFPLEENYFTD